AVRSAGGRVPRALRRVLRPRLRPFGRRRQRLARGAGGAQPRGAVPSGTRPDRGTAALRAHGRAPDHALWRGFGIELPGPEPEVIRAFQGVSVRGGCFAAVAKSTPRRLSP